MGFITVITSATAYALDSWSEKIGRTIGEADVEPLTWAAAELGRAVSAKEYVAAVSLNHAQSRALASWWDGRSFDLLLTPTCASPPPPLGHFAASSENPLQGFERSLPFSVFTSSFNVSGQPGISLPLHWNDDGLPIGVQLVAAYGREDLLIRVAAQLEEAKPWKDRRPHAARLVRILLAHGGGASAARISRRLLVYSSSLISPRCRCSSRSASARSAPGEVPGGIDMA